MLACSNFVKLESKNQKYFVSNQKFSFVSKGKDNLIYIII
jgi:hypothetical protein